MTFRVRLGICLMAIPAPFFLICSANAFSSLPNASPNAARALTQPPLFVSNLMDADFAEMMMGGERYEMVPLPDSMIATTLFIGNLCEFIKDEDLDRLFQPVTNLRSVPACVVRKANMNSLHYGFVTFLTVEEKEKALIKFHGYELNGKIIRVECIQDVPGRNRVRVPERMVAYMCGNLKKTSDGRVNTLRRVSRAEVDRMSKGQAPAKKKKSKKNDNSSKPTVPMRLSEQEQEELGRAGRKGFVSLLSTAYRRGRSSSALANVHREWCDAREKPQIVLCKASGGRPLDHVIVDLSPLRVHGLLDDRKDAENVLIGWKEQVVGAAEKAGMDLREDYVEDNTIDLFFNEEILENEVGDSETEVVLTIDPTAWATQPIWTLPAVSMGVFEGERSKAKAMAKELSELWEIPEKVKAATFDH
eukprot:CAMPEP_0119021610 /NCGR_PEP_ID=MMETSP1176-20130426/26333_1 /TAXON_ID=265551 /ORGANISM="Synedropsis recta cf, Strain CCMP1620" /LENGTH=417 /DNA_ID=CAMNT_0006976253 /DNA_START=134 /DNA_END=1384 /DNA_ORIENTATION=-